MRRFGLGLVLAAMATTARAEVPSVAVDIAPVHSIVSAVMGTLGTPSLIVPPGASPHGYSLRPSEARTLDGADLVVWVGPGLTPWLERPLDTLASQSVKLPLLDAPNITLLEVREGATFAGHDHGGAYAHGHDAEHGHDDDHEDHAHDETHAEHAHDEHAHDDHAHDDHGHDDHAGHDHAHGSVDPHAWLDPQNAGIWATAIAGALSDLDPENAEQYVANAQNFSTEMQILEAEIAAQLAPVSGRPFVVFHDAYQYFERRFGVEAAGAVASVDGDAPSPARVATLRDEVAELGAVCALTEPQFNPGILTALDATNVGEVDPLGIRHDLGPDHYASVLRAMAETLVECLS